MILLLLLGRDIGININEIKNSNDKKYWRTAYRRTKARDDPMNNKINILIKNEL